MQMSFSDRGIRFQKERAQRLSVAAAGDVSFPVRKETGRDPI